jgi:undecaprenyl-diphosphatase
VLVGAVGDGLGAELAPEHARYLYAGIRVAVALALFVYYWRDWLYVLRGLGGAVVRRGTAVERRWAGLLALAAVPSCVAVGLLAHRVRPLLGHPRLAAGALALNGAVMLGTWWWWRRSPRAGGLSGTHRAPLSRGEQAHTLVVELSNLRPARAVLLGLMPLGAIVPGISGIALTLAAALALGLTHEQAAHVALLLLSPFLLVWGLVELPDVRSAAYDHVRSHLGLAAGVAAVAAYLTAALLVRYFRRASLRPFGYYCVLAGVATFVALTVT